MFLSLLNKDPGVEWLRSICLTLQETLTEFSKVYYVILLLAIYESSSPTSGILYLFHFSQSNGCIVTFHSDFNFIGQVSMYTYYIYCLK